MRVLKPPDDAGNERYAVVAGKLAQVIKCGNGIGWEPLAEIVKRHEQVSGERVRLLFKRDAVAEGHSLPVALDAFRKKLPDLTLDKLILKEAAKGNF